MPIGGIHAYYLCVTPRLVGWMGEWVFEFGVGLGHPWGMVCEPSVRPTQ